LLNAALGNKELIKYVGKSYNVGFQEMKFEYCYDCIWIQWVLSQMPFDTCIKVLAETKKHLTPNGIIVVKENIIDNEYEAEFDELDASLIRDDATILEMVRQAGLKIVLNERQGNFPKDISDLIILVLQ
jgi:protein N-terminal methyltransferase